MLLLLDISLGERGMTDVLSEISFMLINFLPLREASINSLNPIQVLASYRQLFCGYPHVCYTINNTEITFR